MERIAIIENGEIVNVVKASADWVEPNGRETISAPRGSGIGIGAVRQQDGSWAMPKPPLEEQERAARTKRDRLLIASDWTQVADAPVDQAAWATYRQALRDIPQQAGFPDDVTWPTKPE